MTERTHFLCELLLNDTRRFVVWYSNVQDGLLLSSSGSLALFDTSAQAEAYANLQSIHLQLQPADFYDFDSISVWCREPHANTLDCSQFLNAWNMLSDISSSLSGWPEFVTVNSSLNKVYDKLFYGSNLPSITPDGQHFEPSWTSKELCDMAKLFDLGIQNLRSIWAA